MISFQRIIRKHPFADFSVTSFNDLRNLKTKPRQLVIVKSSLFTEYCVDYKTLNLNDNNIHESHLVFKKTVFFKKNYQRILIIKSGLQMATIFVKFLSLNSYQCIKNWSLPTIFSRAYKISISLIYQHTSCKTEM